MFFIGFHFTVKSEIVSSQQWVFHSNFKRIHITQNSQRNNTKNSDLYFSVPLLSKNSFLSIFMVFNPTIAPVSTNVTAKYSTKNLGISSPNLTHWSILLLLISLQFQKLSHSYLLSCLLGTRNCHDCIR